MTTSDYKQFTTARRKRHDISYSALTPGIETVTFVHAASGIETTIVAVFDPSDRLLTATIVQRSADSDGARGASTVDTIGEVLLWIEPAAAELRPIAEAVNEGIDTYVAKRFEG